MKSRFLFATAFAAIVLAIPAFSQDVVTTPAPVSTTAPVPHYVRYSATLSEPGSKPLQMRFALYENQSGGQPVWSEIQTVNPVDGKYAVLLGAGTENGLPQSVFSAAQARWLGITVGAGQEQPRTILLATPYSLESSDAQTLAGHPVSDFVLAGSNPAPKSDTKKPNTNTDISLIDVTSGLTINNGGTGPTVTMGVDSTVVPELALANTFTATQTISAGNLAIPATSSATNGVISSGGKAIFQSFSRTSGANNLFLGAGSGNFTNSGKNNTGVGNVSLSALTTAAGNMALGTDSLGKTTSGPYNTAIGAFAGYYNITGGYNTFIGNSAGPPSGSSALTNATAIGASSVVNESNAVVLGGTGAYAVSVGIGTATPSYTLDVRGTGNFTGAVNFAGGQSLTGNQTVNGLSTVTGASTSDTSGQLTASNTSTGDAIYAMSSSGLGIFGGADGLSSTGNDFLGVSYVGVWADSGNQTESGAALLASADDLNTSVMYNDSDNYTTLYLANSGTGGVSNNVAPVLRAGGANDACVVNTKGDITCTGSLKAALPTADLTHQVEVYSVQSPENWIEDFGSGQLAAGTVHVALESTFGGLVNGTVGYHVFLTPKGDCKGLYVTNETATGFDVKELGGGASNAAFDYRIVAKRKGHETERMTDVTKEVQKFNLTSLGNRNTHKALSQSK